jgi:molybdenum cofactor cytidylyltransferase
MPAVIDGILLAAGYSSRMGDFKPLMAHDGLPFVVGIAEKMSRVCRHVVVVIGYHAGDIRAAFVNKLHYLSVEFAENPRFDQGMFTSLQCGAAQLRDADWALYHFCDQPHLPVEFYTEFIGRIEADCDVIQPVYRGQKGHPLLLNHRLLEAVRQAQPKSTLRNLLTDCKIKTWNCSFPQILCDWDTPEDIERSRMQR